LKKKPWHAPDPLERIQKPQVIEYYILSAHRSRLRNRAGISRVNLALEPSEPPPHRPTASNSFGAVLSEQFLK
jgi:hypothetical protein